LLKSELKELLPNMGLSQMANDDIEEYLVDTKFGKVQVGSMLSYQVILTSMQQLISALLLIVRLPVLNDGPLNYPRLPLRNDTDMEIPDTVKDSEEKVLDKIAADEDKLKEIERETRQQADCGKWNEERTYTFTASRFHLIQKRQTNHDTFAETLMHPKQFSSK
jgi:hypothetical protein